MSRSIEEIVAIMWQRRNQDTRLIRGMIDVRDRYNGDMVLPFPDVKNNPYQKPAVANILAEAIDQQASRANSLMPRITVPPKNLSSDSSKDAAEQRRRVLYGRWHTSQLEIKMYRAYRHLIGYGTMSLLVLPSDEDGHAMVELRDPLTAYPELRAPDDVREPENVGFIFGRSLDWIKKHFPGAAAAWLAKTRGQPWDTLWDIVEWIDEDDIVMGIMGPRMPAYTSQEARSYAWSAFELARWKNKAGMVPAVCPRRVTLDRVQGQLMSLIATMDLFGRLTNLEIMAMERAIFPDLVIISKTGGPPTLYSGDWHDGRTGKANLLSDAVVQNLESAPGPMGEQVLQTIEAAVRSTGGAPGIGQVGAARSGAGVEAMSAFSVDPRMQESQAIMARALTALNVAIMETEKGYAPQAHFWVIPGLRSDLTPVSYVPEQLFDFTQTVVDYPYAGMDISDLTVAAVQLNSTKLLSRKEARAIHPLVDDGTQSEDLVTMESLDDSILASLAAQVEQNPGAIAMIAHVRKLVSNGTQLADAVLETMSIMTNQAPPPGGETAPGGTPPGAPGAAPGSPGDQGQLSPDATKLLTAMGAAPGASAPAGAPPPDAGLTDQQKLIRAINTKVTPGAV